MKKWITIEILTRGIDAKANDESKFNSGFWKKEAKVRGIDIDLPMLPALAGELRIIIPFGLSRKENHFCSSINIFHGG